MARFEIAQGYGRHRQGGRNYEAGAELELDRYDPKWGDKFIARGSAATDLKRASALLGRKVWERDLPEALQEAAVAERNARRASAIAAAAQPDEIHDDAVPPALESAAYEDNPEPKPAAHGSGNGVVTPGVLHPPAAPLARNNDVPQPPRRGPGRPPGRRT